MPIDIQHKTFKKALQGYDRTEVDQFLDEVIETLEDDAQERAALQAEIADLKERISHFKAMEESLQNTLVLAQRTADEVKASAHKEADLIKEQARLAAEREISTFTESAAEARREHQRALDSAEKAKSELRSLLMTHLALLERAVPQSNGIVQHVQEVPMESEPAPLLGVSLFFCRDCTCLVLSWLHAPASGVAGTPRFFINGRRHQGAYDVATLSQAVRSARTRARLRVKANMPEAAQPVS